jgi:hypothetical protein
MTRACVAAIVALLVLSLTGCNQNKYRVVERIDRYVDKQGHHLSDEWYWDLSYDHEQVIFVLTHGSHRIHATCDLSTVDKLDPKASCGLRPLRTYECVLGPDDIWTAPDPVSDLKCKDGGGRSVYLYVSKEE